MLGLFNTEKLLKTQIDDSIARSEQYVLSRNINKDVYGDQYYQTCIQDISLCPNASDDFYKRLDIYDDFVFLQSEPLNSSVFSRQISTADGFLRSFVADLPRETIDYSYFDPTKPGGTRSFDSFCIEGWIYNDTTVYRIMKSQLKDSGWADPSTADPFRKLIDETWCVELLGENNENPQTIHHLIDLKKNEFLNYINGTDYLDRKVLSGVHILLMLQRLREYGYDTSNYTSLIQFTESYVANETLSGNLYYPLEVDHNALYILSSYHYSDKALMETIARNIILSQNDDGSWTGSPGGQYSLLTTLRCLIALNLFEKNYL